MRQHQPSVAAPVQGRSLWMRCALRIGEMGLGSDFCCSSISLHIRFRPSALTKCISSSAGYVTIPRMASPSRKQIDRLSLSYAHEHDSVITDGVMTQIRDRGNLTLSHCSEFVQLPAELAVK